MGKKKKKVVKLTEFGRFQKAITKPTLVKKSNIRYIQSDINKPTQRVLSKGQEMLTEIMGGTNQSWGTGQNLPKINGELRSGKGLIKNDDFGETGSMFGI